ncbi:choline ABC transporter ATP-binding [Micractinium conductrix]|uniref:Choline ABC transporter ATP-binding n=1 Tax=Micractinium conductrix TaxID=554055 RepID=A0A2P6VBF4_9CHLO|nr:choline ABC transporter ATP-binding [Micractinium conductrix]|eukprot:PSC71416.1 choline ABC transporter ATP-binding [Micractinium conductrix]
MAARLSLLALALWLAVAFAAEAPPTCSDPAFESSGSIYVVQDGNLTGDDDAAAAVLLLQAFVASELHKDEACEVTETVIDGIACSRPVEEGDVLEGDTKVETDGIVFDAQVAQKVVCPDGSYWVRYEARGIKVADSDALENIETRFIEVFDSSYV